MGEYNWKNEVSSICTWRINAKVGYCPEQNGEFRLANTLKDSKGRNLRLKFLALLLLLFFSI